MYVCTSCKPYNGPFSLLQFGIGKPHSSCYQHTIIHNESEVEGEMLLNDTSPKHVQRDNVMSHCMCVCVL